MFGQKVTTLRYENFCGSHSSFRYSYRAAQSTSKSENPSHRYRYIWKVLFVKQIAQKSKIADQTKPNWTWTVPHWSWSSCPAALTAAVWIIISEFLLILIAPNNWVLDAASAFCRQFVCRAQAQALTQTWPADCSGPRECMWVCVCGSGSEPGLRLFLLQIFYSNAIYFIYCSLWAAFGSHRFFYFIALFMQPKVNYVWSVAAAASRCGQSRNKTRSRTKSSSLSSSQSLQPLSLFSICRVKSCLTRTKRRKHMDESNVAAFVARPVLWDML